MTHRKSEHGFGMLEVLIAVSITIILMAMFAQNMVSLIQQRNEKNAKAGVLALMKAETEYQTMFPSTGYVYGSNLHFLNDCPATATPVPQGVTPNGCLAISRSYTNDQTAYQYNFSVTQIPPLGQTTVTNTSADGYLATATPIDKTNGRLTFCVSNEDGIIRGAVNNGSNTPQTEADCEAYDVRDAGLTSTPAASSLPTTYTTIKPAVIVSICGTGCAIQQTFTTTTGLNLPAGQYLVTVSSIFAQSQAAEVKCVLTDSNGTLSPTSPTPGSSRTDVGASLTAAVSVIPFVIHGVTTAEDGDQITLTCSQTVPGTDFWLGEFPEGLSGPPWSIGPTQMTAILVNNTPQ